MGAFGTESALRATASTLPAGSLWNALSCTHTENARAILRRSSVRRLSVNRHVVGPWLVLSSGTAEDAVFSLWLASRQTFSPQKRQ